MHIKVTLLRFFVCRHRDCVEAESLRFRAVVERSSPLSDVYLERSSAFCMSFLRTSRAVTRQLGALLRILWGQADD